MLTTADQISKFLEMHEENSNDAERIIAFLQEEKKVDLRPQLIPLRSRDQNGQFLTGALEAFKRWRRQIFQNQNNKKAFQMVSHQGQDYTGHLRYINCPTNVLTYIIQQSWYLSVENQNELIQTILDNPEGFKASIVQKPDKSGNTWLMLHVEKRD